MADQRSAAASWRARLVALVAVTVVATLALTAAAEAAKWRKVTNEPQPSNTSEVGLERTADGVLHVLWPRDSGASEQVMHSAIAANGNSVAGPHQVAATSNFVNDSVDLVPGPGGGVRALFTGLFPGTVNNEMRTATAPSAGTPWTVHVPASSTSSPTNPAAGAGVGAAVNLGGVPWSAWGDSSPGGGGFHAGINPADADAAFDPSCCQRDPNIAVDAQTGIGFVAWNSLPPGGAPNRLQVVAPLVTGIESAPKSGAVWLQQRVGLTARIGAGGVYTAYGSGSNPFNARPALWRVGAAKAKVIKTPPDAEHTTVAPAPGGRLWIAWEGKDRGKRIFATRTNPAATKFGAIVGTKPPPGTDQVHRLNVEGSRGFLDVVALVQRGSNDIAHWTARLLPGLTLKAAPGKVKAGKKVTFTAADAGSPVANASVKLKLGKKTKTRKTNAKGKAKIKVPAATKPGRYAATASKGGYAPGKRKIKVR